MEAIVAVYENWGIGKDGAQPLSLSADRQFFRKLTLGKTVIMGRHTMETLPENKPLDGRVNVVLSRSQRNSPGFVRISNLEQAAFPNAMVIGGGMVYAQLLPLCERVYVTKIAAQVDSDTFFPNLDESPDWQLEKVLQAGEENGIPYQICSYIPVL